MFFVVLTGLCRYSKVDIVKMFCLQYWYMLLLHFSGYDINCQYRINFKERWEALGKLVRLLGISSVTSTEVPRTIAAVGKFHLAAHIPACRFKFSYHYLPGAAMTDGEGSERIWAIMNKLSSSTQEMLSGHRHDRINHHHADMNVRRLHSSGELGYINALRADLLMSCVATTTAKGYRTALKHWAERHEFVKNLERVMKKEQVAACREKERKFVEDVVDMAKHATLENIYEPNKGKGESYRAQSIP